MWDVMLFSKGQQMGRPKNIEWVFFDFDGTLADTEPFGFELDRKTFAAFGIKPSDEELYTLPGTTGYESIPAIFAHHGLTVSAQDYFAKRPSNEWVYFEAPIELSPGIFELLVYLDSHSIKRAVVSTTRRSSIRRALCRLGIEDYFEVLVCGDEAGQYKPDPAPYQRALKLAHTHPSQVVAFEDSPTGITSARSAGIYTFGYRGSSLPLDTSLADEQLDSFEGFRL